MTVPAGYETTFRHDRENGDRPEHPAEAWAVVTAADLLAAGDPGPTPWLIEGLIVEGALAAVVGKWKTGKSWAVLDLAVAVVTGGAAFGVHPVPNPGPVLVVQEESGRAAMHRRLDALARGRAISGDRLADLALSLNQRVRLDDPAWVEALVGSARGARAVFLDPLARLRNAGHDENTQRDSAIVIDAIRFLRDETGAAVVWVAHTGHSGDTMRGSSDLESVWESRLGFARDGDTVTVKAEHRDAEADDPIAFRLDWHAETRTMRLRSTLPPLTERVLDFLRDHGPAGTEEVARGIGVRRSEVARTLDEASRAGTTSRFPSERRNESGRVSRPKLWHLSTQATLPDLTTRPEPGTTPDDSPSASTHVPRPVPPTGGDGRDGTPQGRAGHPEDEPTTDETPPCATALWAEADSSIVLAARPRDASGREPDLDVLVDGVVS